MCHIITVAFPPEADLELLAFAFDRQAMALQPVENPSVRAELPPGWRYGRATTGMCDCGSALGAPPDQAIGWAPRSTHEGRDHGPGKQARGRASREAAWRAREDAVYDLELRLVRELQQWEHLITSSFALGATDRFGVLRHWYSQGVDEERFGFSMIAVPRADLDVSYLRCLHEDVLYVFHGA